ncbi:OmpW/AlkL family protein [Porticoccus sp.]|uniref:OmpW/AlkL family protein n=1 Tax=Porticoccus sp. TaxID=2024853 RepID=UPI003F6A2A17
MLKQKALSLAVHVVLSGALLVGTTAAMAYESGDVIVRAGAATVEPNDDSSRLTLNGAGLTNSRAYVDSDTQLGLTLTYMLTNHLGLGLLAATPFKHDIKAKNLLVPGKIDAGSTKHLPPTLTLQYFPMDAESKFQPYAGVGINYTKFFEEDVAGELEGVVGASGKLKLDDSWGVVFELGMDYALTDRWVVNAAVWYLDIDTDAKFNFPGAEVKTKVEVDPLVYMVGIGYKF